MKHRYTFDWTNKSLCAADYMMRFFREHHIIYGHNSGFELCACLDGKSCLPVTYYHIEENTFGIAYRPFRTCNYFRMPNKELSEENNNGYTKEECLILDSGENDHPFCETLLDAMEQAEYYRENGYQDVTVLERLNNHYAVIAKHYQPERSVKNDAESCKID